MSAGEKILRVVIAGDALGAVTALGELSHGLEHAHSSAETHGSGITGILGGAAKGIGLFAVGAVGAAGLVADEFYKVGSGYEQNLNAIQAFTHSTTDQMKTLEDQLYGMAPQFAQMGQTVGDASTELYDLTKAGASSKDAMTELTPSMALAKATNTDFSESAKEMTRVLNAFGLKASDSSMVADTLTNATHTSTQTLQDLSDGLGYVSVAAHDFGVDLQTTTAVMAMYANAGIQGTRAGTAFQSMFQRLGAPTAAATKAMHAIGLEAFDAQGKLKPLGDIFQQLQDKFGKGLDAHSLQQITPYLKDIFGARGVEPILVAMKQGGGGLQKYIDLMHRQGEATALAQAKSKGLSGTLNELKATVESTVQHLYMKAAPKVAEFLQPIVAGIPGALTKFGELGKRAFEAFSQGASGGGTGGAAGGGMGKIFASLGEFTRNVLIPEIKGIGHVIVKDVVPVMRDGLRIFAAIAPVVLKIAEGLAKDVAPILRDIGKFVEKDVLPSLRKMSVWVATDLVPKIEQMWSKLQPILAMLAAWIDKKIVPLLDWAWKKMQPLFKDLGKLVTTLVESLTGLFMILKPILSFVLDVFGGPFIDVIKGFLDGVFRAVKGVMEILQGILDFVSGVFSGNWSKAWTGIKEFFAGILNAIVGLVELLIFGKLLKLATAGFKAIGDAIMSPLNDVYDFMSGLWDNIGKLWEGSIQGIKMIWSLMWQNVKDDFVSFATEQWRNFSNWAGKLWDWFSALPGKILGYLRSAGQWLLLTGLDLLEGLLNGIERGAVGAWNWLKALPGTVKGYLSDVGNWLIDAGWNMLMGMINGIQQAAGHLKDATVGAVKAAYDGVTSFLGINSPSRLYMKVGHSQGEGLIKGVQAKAQDVHKAIVGMVDVPAARFTAAFRQQSQTAARAAATNARHAGQLWAANSITDGAQGVGGGMTVNVTINVAGSIQAEKDFAKKMATAIRDEIRQIGRRNGGSTGLTGIA